jgi:L-lactate dehydrogenase complex protein LldE
MDTGADYIISTDASCLMHLDGFANKQGKKIQTIHLADVLAHF